MEATFDNIIKMFTEQVPNINNNLKNKNFSELLSRLRYLNYLVDTLYDKDPQENTLDIVCDELYEFITEYDVKLLVGYKLDFLRNL